MTGHAKNFRTRTPGGRSGTCSTLMAATPPGMHAGTRSSARRILMPSGRQSARLHVWELSHRTSTADPSGSAWCTGRRAACRGRRGSRQPSACRRGQARPVRRLPRLAPGRPLPAGNSKPGSTGWPMAGSDWAGMPGRVSCPGMSSGSGRISRRSDSAASGRAGFNPPLRAAGAGRLLRPGCRRCAGVARRRHGERP